MSGRPRWGGSTGGGQESDSLPPAPGRSLGAASAPAEPPQAGGEEQKVKREGKRAPPSPLCLPPSTPPSRPGASRGGCRICSCVGHPELWGTKLPHISRGPWQLPAADVAPPAPAASPIPWPAPRPVGCTHCLGQGCPEGGVGPETTPSTLPLRPLPPAHPHPTCPPPSLFPQPRTQPGGRAGGLPRQQGSGRTPQSPAMVGRGATRPQPTPLCPLPAAPLRFPRLGSAGAVLPPPARDPGKNWGLL